MISSRRRSSRTKEPLLERLVDLYLSRDDVIAELRITLYVKKRLTNRSRRIAYVTKEGNMRIFTAESVNLSHLNPGRYSYEPKNIHVEAVYVTPENIGKLSLEFEEELFYDVTGRPYFAFDAERRSVDDGESPETSQLYVRLTDWIVPLRGELHIYRDQTFQSTFTPDGGQLWPQAGAHSSAPRTVPAELVVLRDKLRRDANQGVRVRHKSTGAYGNTEGMSGPGSWWVTMDGASEALEYSTEELEFPDLATHQAEILGPTGTAVAQHLKD